jgi:putative thioredoxin
MAVDVTESSFAADVLERSGGAPVVVDFWAAWCGPCRQLGPVLEDAVAARGGAITLAKVDTDANPGLAARYGIRGIPAVKAFRNGAVVAEFVGAQPRVMVDRFLDALLPSPAEQLVAAGDPASLRAAIEADPDHIPARVALARLLLREGEVAEAEAVLRPVEHDRVAAGLLARIQLQRADGAGGPVPAALARLDTGEVAAALPELVQAIREAGGEDRDLLRRVIVGAFAEQGEGDPLVQRLRPLLAAALY